MVDGIRTGGGPVIVEADTYRWHGHYEGDPQHYRTAEERAEGEAKDPLVVPRRPPARAPASPTHAIAALEDEVAGELDAAVDAGPRRRPTRRPARCSTS